MIYLVICVVVFIITTCVIKDTHCKYYEGYNYASLQKEWDVKLPIWAVIVIFLISLIPILNILAFIAFVIYYIVHANWNPQGRGDTHVFFLNGKNFVTKSIKWICRILNKPI